MNELHEMEKMCAAVPAPDRDRLAGARARLLGGITATTARRADGRSRAALGGFGRLAGRRPRRLMTRPRIALTGVAAAGLAGVVAAAVIVPGAGGGAAGQAGSVRLTAAMVLHQAARAALTAPSPGNNQFIYVDTINNNPRYKPKNWVTKEWINLEGQLGIAQVASCGSVIGPAFKQDPGCWMPVAPIDQLPFTYRGLQRLPASPRMLLGYLDREQTEACGTLGAGLSRAVREWSGVVTILDNVPLLPPRFGAALFNAAAQIPGVRVIRNVRTASGQPGIAVAMTWRDDGATRSTELIFSSHTYRYIGNVEQGRDTSFAPESSALLTTGFTRTSPDHPRPHFGWPLWNCVGTIGGIGS